MSVNFYSIRSKSSKLYDTPFPCENDQRAIYELRYLINSERQSAISAMPDDHELYRVATFDTESGKMKHQNDCLLKDLSVLVRPKVSDAPPNFSSLWRKKEGD